MHKKPFDEEPHRSYDVYLNEEYTNIFSWYIWFIFPFRDGNIGLAKQVVSSLYKKNIQRLTKTFLTLSLSDVASRVQLASPAEAEKYVLRMVMYFPTLSVLVTKLYFIEASIVYFLFIYDCGIAFKL